MQLILLLGSLVAINLGVVYVGSENIEENSPQSLEGVVEVEDVSNSTDESTAPTEDTTD